LYFTGFWVTLFATINRGIRFKRNQLVQRKTTYEMKKLAFIAALSAAAFLQAVPAEASTPAVQDSLKHQTNKERAKTGTHQMGHGAKELGKGTKNVAVSGAKATGKGAKKVGTGVVKGTKKAGKAVKNTTKKGINKVDEKVD
jgi:hypothetical protein